MSGNWNEHCRFACMSEFAEYLYTSREEKKKSDREYRLKKQLEWNMKAVPDAHQAKSRHEVIEMLRTMGPGKHRFRVTHADYTEYLLVSKEGLDRYYWKRLSIM